ncbi:MAG: immunity 52 family protein [Hyphomicrobiales bacterium]|nr:immunity 52 family protein [Hyphomicrobiales bacterium]MBV8661984.1 immunity 52 family protein [Hyphomicrobiales bacterium]
MTSLELNLWWGSRDPSQADDARRLAQFISGLPDFDPIYRSWLNSRATKEQKVPVPLSEIQAKQLLIDNVTQRELDAGPWPELGSDIWGGHAGPPPYDFRTSSYADTHCSVGAFGRHATVYPNNVFMRLSKLRPSTGRPWRASELRPLMKFAREIWKPAEMCAMFSFYILDLPMVPDPTWAAGERLLRPWIGWITYLPPNLAARANYPADVEVDSLEDGAALVTLCEEPFEKTDAEGLARLHALEAALRPLQS